MFLWCMTDSVIDLIHFKYVKISKIFESEKLSLSKRRICSCFNHLMKTLELIYLIFVLASSDSKLKILKKCINTQTSHCQYKILQVDMQLPHIPTTDVHQSSICSLDWDFPDTVPTQFLQFFSSYSVGEWRETCCWNKENPRAISPTDWPAV